VAEILSKSKLKYFLTLAVSTVLLVSILFFADLEKILETVGNVEPLYFLAAVLFGNIPILLNARIWQNTMEFLGDRKNYLDTVKMLYGFSFINNVTPFGNLGGEPIIAYRVSKNVEKDYETVLSAVFFTGVIIFLPMILVLPLASVYLGLYSGVNPFIVIEVATAIFLSFFVLRKLYSERVDLLIDVSSRFGVEEKFEKFRDGFKIYRDDRKNLIEALLISSTGMLFDVVCLYILVLAISAPVNFLVLLAIVPLARLSNFAPSPGGSGFYEAGLTGLLVLFTPLVLAEAVSVALLYRLSTFYIGILLGYLELNLGKTNQR